MTTYRTLWLSLATATALAALPHAGQAQTMAPQMPADMAEPAFGNSVLRQIIQMQLNSRGGMPVGAPGAEADALLGKNEKREGGQGEQSTGSFAPSPQFGISAGASRGTP